jgi:hypothetical protein
MWLGPRHAVRRAGPLDRGRAGSRLEDGQDGRGTGKPIIYFVRGEAVFDARALPESRADFGVFGAELDVRCLHALSGAALPFSCLLA